MTAGETSRVRLRSGVVLAPADNGRWQARWDFDSVMFLEGSACQDVLPWLAPRLDGRSAYEEILAAGAARFSRATLEEVLRQLTDGGLITVGDPVKDRAVATSILVCGTRTLARRLVRNFSENEFCAVTLADSWEAVRARLDPGCAPGDPVEVENESRFAFATVVATDWLPQQLDAFNEWALHARRRWMVLGAWNSRALIGPIFVPGETACYRCYQDRLSSHRRHLEAYRELDRWLRERETPVDEPSSPAMEEVAAGLASLEVFADVTGARAARTLGRVLIFQPEEDALRVENVLRVPWCEACSRVRQVGE